MAKKIDPFGALTTDVPEEPTEAIPEVLAHRPSKAKRNRSWERDNPTRSYRGIPNELHNKLKRISERLSVPIGDVVRAFLEHGLACYEDGTLTLERELATGKYTLYPE